MHQSFACLIRSRVSGVLESAGRQARQSCRLDKLYIFRCLYFCLKLTTDSFPVAFRLILSTHFTGFARDGLPCLCSTCEHCIYTAATFSASTSSSNAPVSSCFGTGNKRLLSAISSSGVWVPGMVSTTATKAYADRHDTWFTSGCISPPNFHIWYRPINQCPGLVMRHVVIEPILSDARKYLVRRALVPR